MTGSRQLKTQVRDLLMGLGACRTEVAETLRGLGVRGAPRDRQDCAIAVYLRAVLGADLRVQSVSVQNGVVKVVLDEPTRFHRLNLVTVLLPEPVRQFIVAFDEAVYLTLIREGSSNPLQLNNAKQREANGAACIRNSRNSAL